MFISPSSPTLSSTVSTSGTVSGNIHSARPFPLPDLLPLSTRLTPPNQTSTPSSYFPLGFRSLPPSELPPTMPPSGAAGYLGALDVVDPSSQSSPSVSAPLDSPRQTSTSVGTSLPPSSAFSSNSDVSASFTSWLAASGTMLTSSLAISSSPSPSVSTNSPSISGLPFTSTPTKTLPLPFPTTSTAQTFSSPAPVSSSDFTSSPLPSSPVFTSSTPPLTSSTTRSPSAVPTTVVFSSTVVISLSAPSASNSPYTPTYTITSVLLGQGATITEFVTTSQVLSTEPPGSTVNSTLSPGTIAAIVLGIVGAFAFSALWLFCARRRQRQLVREAALIPPENHASGPLDDEILEDVEEFGFGTSGAQGAGNHTTQTGPVMEERYAGILAALHSTERLGRGNEGGSTGGIYGSRHDIATDMDWDDDLTRASSPTLPLHVLPPDDPPYMAPLSPPPPVSQPSHYQSTQPAPPPSAYNMTTRRKSSPGPDAAGWLSGYGVPPSYHSHYARSQTLGSGSGSGSVDALIRTRTGSEEPLLGIGKAAPEVSAGVSTLGDVSPTIVTDPGSNRLGLGSAFGSPTGSIYSPSTIYAALQDTSGSYGTRTASGSGSYGYARSGTPSSFDILRSVSSQGALSSAHSHGHGQSQGFKFGFSKAGSLSSGSTGRKAGSNQHSFGLPPTSFRARKDRGSISSDKDNQGEKQSLREKDWKPRPRSWTSASNSGSVDEKQGRGSPVMGVRALLGRLRRAGHTPSPRSSIKDLQSSRQVSMDVDPEKAAADRVTSPPIQIEAATPQRRRLSLILSNPDPHPPSPFSGAGDVLPTSDTPPNRELHPIQYEMPTGDPHGRKPVSFGDRDLQPATPLSIGYVLVPTPSPAPTEESHLAEGLLHPRLQTQGFSDSSLRDFEDYSRPIGGVVKNRLYSTTTFGTQDDASLNRGTPVQDIAPSDEHDHQAIDVFGSLTHSDVPRDSWSVDDLPPPARRSPGP